MLLFVPGYLLWDNKLERMFTLMCGVFYSRTFNVFACWFCFPVSRVHVQCFPVSRVYVQCFPESRVYVQCFPVSCVSGHLVGIYFAPCVGFVHVVLFTGTTPIGELPRHGGCEGKWTLVGVYAVVQGLPSRVLPGHCTVWVGSQGPWLMHVMMHFVCSHVTCVHSLVRIMCCVHVCSLSVIV